MRTIRTPRGIVSLLVVVATFGSAFGAEEPRSASTQDVCHDEAVAWVKRRLGADTQILAAWTDRSGIQHKQVTGWRVLVWTDRCAGYFTMGFGVRAIPECAPSHGERTPMMRMAGAVGDCRRLVPRMDFPA
jgi:hypothetical protein